MASYRSWNHSHGINVTLYQNSLAVDAGRYSSQGTSNLGVWNHLLETNPTDTGHAQEDYFLPTGYLNVTGIEAQLDAGIPRVSSSIITAQPGIFRRRQLGGDSEYIGNEIFDYPRESQLRLTFPELDSRKRWTQMPLSCFVDAMMGYAIAAFQYGIDWDLWSNESDGKNGAWTAPPPLDKPLYFDLSLLP